MSSIKIILSIALLVSSCGVLAKLNVDGEIEKLRAQYKKS
ncbi:MAG: hypothetical protein Rsou_0505 [Candidatus Ruthia sp. Asou_11_S2]|nr:hypothetical protein [Candidatus Ruthia sp. Asou_11_S2]